MPGEESFDSENMSDIMLYQDFPPISCVETCAEDLCETFWGPLRSLVRFCAIAARNKKLVPALEAKNKLHQCGQIYVNFDDPACQRSLSDQANLAHMSQNVADYSAYALRYKQT